MQAAVESVLTADGEKTFLHDVSWESYIEMCDANESPGVRMTYDRGRLEIMTVSLGHEHPNRLIQDLFACLAEGFNVEFFNAGSVTLRDKAVRAGFEPDTCFYVRNLERLRGKKKLELPRDPAPDLVIEVDVSRSSAWKLRAYGVLGIREAWRYTGEEIRLYALNGEEHSEITTSSVLPGVTAADLTALVAAYPELGSLAWRRHVRQWAEQRGV